MYRICYNNIELSSFCNSVSRLLVATVLLSPHPRALYLTILKASLYYMVNGLLLCIWWMVHWLVSIRLWNACFPQFVSITVILSLEHWLHIGSGPIHQLLLYIRTTTALWFILFYSNLSKVDCYKLFAFQKSITTLFYYGCTKQQQTQFIRTKK